MKDQLKRLYSKAKEFALLYNPEFIEEDLREISISEDGTIEIYMEHYYGRENSETWRHVFEPEELFSGNVRSLVGKYKAVEEERIKKEKELRAKEEAIRNKNIRKFSKESERNQYMRLKIKYESQGCYFCKKPVINDTAFTEDADICHGKCLSDHYIAMDAHREDMDLMGF